MVQQTKLWPSSGSTCGLPNTVITAARTKLNELESSSTTIDRATPQNSLDATQSPVQLQLDQTDSAIFEALDNTDPDELSPKQAHELLYLLKTLRQK